MGAYESPTKPPPNTATPRRRRSSSSGRPSRKARPAASNPARVHRADHCGGTLALNDDLTPQRSSRPEAGVQHPGGSKRRWWSSATEGPLAAAPPHRIRVLAKAARPTSPATSVTRRSASLKGAQARRVARRPPASGALRPWRWLLAAGPQPRGAGLLRAPALRCRAPRLTALSIVLTSSRCSVSTRSASPEATASPRRWKKADLRGVATVLEPLSLGAQIRFFCEWMLAIGSEKSRGGGGRAGRTIAAGVR